MARCAGHGVITGNSSVSCASRSLVGASRRLNQAVEEDLLEVARRAGWVGAARHVENSSWTGLTDSCASRRTDGAARQHGNLCKFLHSLRRNRFYSSLSLISLSWHTLITKTIMLKKVLGKGKKTHSSRDEEPVRKKRSTRDQASGEGGSRPQATQAQEEQQGELSYAASFVVSYPYLTAGQHSWSDRFYREECKKRIEK
ncbi:hypothetical protein A2U01_0022670 [Trifolium medium]|uniref:Uncharacterized protein n=1 Tax=Trifolium medium TaxID=97028 RepID=A0A392NPB0_9FABA|nr:hypothetical protein [Trifolium medium]